MALEAGKLRHLGALQEQVQTQDPVTLEFVVTWELVAMVWAAIEPLSAREFTQSAANQSQVTARITIRYREGVTAAMRFVHGSKIYNIEDVLADKESGLEYLTLPCSEGVNDGE